MVFTSLKDRFTHRHDRALVKAIRAQNLSKVKQAFAKGASPDAIYEAKPSWANRILPVTPLIHRKEPVLLVAVRGKSLDILEEVLRHKPDMEKRSWSEESGRGGDCDRTLTEQILGDHLYWKAKNFAEAEEMLTERAAAKPADPEYAAKVDKAKVLHKYLP